MEPYPKSRALELHEDDLEECDPGRSEGVKGGKVRLEPFVGIGPRRFFDYFSINLGSGYLLERKSPDGTVVVPDATNAAPRVQASEIGFLSAEEQLADDIRPFLDTGDDD